MKTKTTVLILCMCMFLSFSLVSKLVERPSLQELPRLYAELKPSVVTLEGSWNEEILPGIFIPKGVGASGFIVDTDKGYIVTVGHFADDKYKIKVILSTGQEIDASIKAVDKENDCAILQVNPLLIKDIPEVKFSKEIFVGEFIFAIGSPLRLSNTITHGILSNGPTFPKYWANFPCGVYHSDMTIIPGNSGCPVFNLEGEVVAMAVGNLDWLAILVPAETTQNLIDSINSVN